MYSKQPLNRPLASPIFTFLTAPTSLGCLALAYMCAIVRDIGEELKQILLEHSCFFVNCLRGPENDLTDHSLLFIALCLHRQNINVKEFFVRSHLVEACISLMRAKKRHLKLLSVDVCANIIKDYEDAQRIFFRNKGECELYNS